jgi:hypothetical protein
MSAHRRSTLWQRRAQVACFVALAACSWSMVSAFGWWALWLMVLAVAVTVIWGAAE